RVGSRNRLPERERDSRRRVDELARAETPAQGAGKHVNAVTGTSGSNPESRIPNPKSQRPVLWALGFVVSGPSEDNHEPGHRFAVLVAQTNPLQPLHAHSCIVCRRPDVRFAVHIPARVGELERWLVGLLHREGECASWAKARRDRSKHLAKISKI